MTFPFLDELLEAQRKLSNSSRFAQMERGATGPYLMLPDAKGHSYLHYTVLL